MFFERERGNLCVYLWFNRRFEQISSETRWISFCLLILALKPKINRCFFFFFTGSISSSSFTLLLTNSLWSVLEFVTSSDEFAPWIAEKPVQWWWFFDESLRTVMNLLNLVLIFDSGELGFWDCSWCSWEFLSFWSNWIEREISDSVCDVAWILWLSLTLCTIYKLPSVILDQWNGDTCLWT